MIELEKTGRGCTFLMNEWTYLKSKLASRWQSSDRFRAIRLLGAQPLDAKEHRHIAEIFLASHALGRTGKNTNPFQDLKDEMLHAENDTMEAEAYKEWPDIVRKNQKAEGRALLTRLVEANIERLAAKIEAFNPKTDALGKKTFEGLSFDDSPLGKRLNINLQKLSNSLDRRLSKIRKECREEREGSGLRRSWRQPDSRPGRGVEMEPSARQSVRAGSAAATGAGGGGPAPTHEAGVCVDPKRGPAGGNATGESWENPGNRGSMVDHVLAHGFAGAEGVRPADDGDAEGVEPGLADDAVDGTVVAADGENTATCDAGLQVVELGENREIDTSEANFRENVITAQAQEGLGVTAELAVGAGLDSGVDRHVLSPDLVCPDSGRESGEAAITVEGPGSQTPATVLDRRVVSPDLVGPDFGREAAITVGAPGSQTPATVLDQHVVSADLVCPDSGRELRDAAITVDGSGSQTPVTVLDWRVVSPDLVGPDFGREAGEAAVSGLGGERAEEGPQAGPVAEQTVVVGERRRDRRGDRTRVQPSKTERKRLRWEMARREMERRRVARQKERESRCDERIGGVHSIVPDVGAVLCEEHVRAP